MQYANILKVLCQSVFLIAWNSISLLCSTYIIWGLLFLWFGRHCIFFYAATTLINMLVVFGLPFKRTSTGILGLSFIKKDLSVLLARLCLKHERYLVCRPHYFPLSRGHLAKNNSSQFLWITFTTGTNRMAFLLRTKLVRKLEFLKIYNLKNFPDSRCRWFYFDTLH
jgi:hypothetical protein